jgi:hypothetical protein
MRRKTAPKDPVHPEVSRAVASEVGLIAKAEEGAHSAVGEYVLDNRSHRTTQGSGVRGSRKPFVRPKTCPDSHPLQPSGRPLRVAKCLATKCAAVTHARMPRPRTSHTDRAIIGTA